MHQVMTMEIKIMFSFRELIYCTGLLLHSFRKGKYNNSTVNDMYVCGVLADVLYCKDMEVMVN